MGVCCAPSWFAEGGLYGTVLLPVFSHFIVIGGHTYYREGGTSFCEDESIRPMSVILDDKDFALLFGFPSNLGIVVWAGLVRRRFSAFRVLYAMA